MARAARCGFTPDLLFLANFLNLLLMGLYVWADYGRGYLVEDPSRINALYMALAFAYVLDGALYLYAHEGELPWPSGFSMWSDWLSCAGNCVFAVTACLYPRESSEAITTFVLVAEASASLVNGAAAICGLAGWWMESNKETAAVGCSGEAWGLLTSLDFWAHVTNFLPAVVYMGSSVAAAEINYARLSDQSSGAGAVKLPELLRQLARVYWYGDILWTLNAAFWLALWVRDYQYEQQLLAEEEEVEGGGVAAAGAASKAAAGAGMMQRLLEGDGLGHGAGGAPLLTPYKGSLQAPDEDHQQQASAPAGSSTAQRLHRERRKKRHLLRDTEPYHLYIPFLRWAYAVGGCWGRYRSLRGSHEVDAGEGEGEGGGGGTVGSAAGAGAMGQQPFHHRPSPHPSPPLHHRPAQPPLTPTEGGGAGAAAFSPRSPSGPAGAPSPRGSSAVVSGPRVLKLLAVSTLAANVESRRAAAASSSAASAGKGGALEMLEMTDRRR